MKWQYNVMVTCGDDTNVIIKVMISGGNTKALPLSSRFLII